MPDEPAYRVGPVAYRTGEKAFGPRLQLGRNACSPRVRLIPLPIVECGSINRFPARTTSFRSQHGKRTRQAPKTFSERTTIVEIGTRFELLS